MSDPPVNSPEWWERQDQRVRDLDASIPSHIAQVQRIRARDPRDFDDAVRLMGLALGEVARAVEAARILLRLLQERTSPRLPNPPP